MNLRSWDTREELGEERIEDSRCICTSLRNYQKKGKKGRKEEKKEKQCKLYCEKLNVRILFEMSNSDSIECAVW